MSLRWLFKGAYGPLLALCALVAVLWVGSYRSIAHAKLPVSPGATRWEFTSYRGLLAIALVENHPTSDTAYFIARSDDAALAAEWDNCHWTGATGGIGFDDAQVLRSDYDGMLVVRHWTALTLPYWLLMSIPALGLARGVYVALRAHRRVTHNQCGDCGYDLGDGAICQACAARARLIGA